MENNKEITEDNKITTPELVNPKLELSEADKIKEDLKRIRSARGKNTFSTGLTKTSSIDFSKHAQYVKPQEISLLNPDEVSLKLVEDRKASFEYNQAKKNADEQGIWGEAGNALLSLPEKLGSKTLTYAGYLLDFDSHFDFLFGNGEEVGNWLSDLGESWNKSVDERLPIYRHPEGSGGVFERGHEWFWVNAADLVADPLTLLGVARIPLIASKVALGSRITAGVTKAGLKLNKPTKGFLEGIKTASVSRLIESSAEAHETYKSEVQKLSDARDRGENRFSDEEIKQVAGDAAAFTWRNNWWMLAQDMIQYSKLFRGMPVSKAIDDTAVARAAGKSRLGAVVTREGKSVLQAGGEALEEGGQFIISEEGKNYAEVKAGLKKETSFSERFNDYTQQGEFWDSVMLGGLGGKLFDSISGKAMDFVNRKLGKEVVSERQIRLNEIQTRQQRMAMYTTQMKEAAASNNEYAYKAAKRGLAANLGFEAAKSGNLDLVMENLTAYQNATDEQIDKLGLDRNELGNINELKAEVQKAAKIYQTASKYSKRPDIAALNNFNVDYWNSELKKEQVKASELESTYPRYQELTIAGKDLFNLRVEKMSLDKTAKEIQKINTIEPDSKYEKMLTDIDKKLKENIAKTDELIAAKQYTTDDIDILNPLTISADGTFANTNVAELVSSKTSQELYKRFINKTNEETAWLETAEADKYYADIAVEVQKKMAEAAIKAQEEASKKAAEDKVANAKNNNIKPSTVNPNISKADENRLSALLYTNDDIKAFTAEEVKDILLNKKKKQKVSPTGDTVTTNEEFTSVQDLETLEGMETTVVQDTTIRNTSSITSQEVATNDEEEDTLGEVLRSQSDEEISPLKEVLGLAWKSARNSRASASDKTSTNTDKSSYLENPNYDIVGAEVRLEVDTDRINTFKEYSAHRDALTEGSGLTEELLGTLPVRVVILKDGKPVRYKGVEIDGYIHNYDYPNFDPDIAEVAKTQILSLKSKVLKAHLNGTTYNTKIASKGTGYYNITDREATNSLLDIHQTTESSDIKLAVSVGREYVDSNGPIKVLEEYAANEKLQGSVYTLMTAANGKIVPVRVRVSKLTNDEASFLTSVYKKLIVDKVNVQDKIDKDTISAIKKSEDPRVNSILDFFDEADTTYAQLISFFVFDGNRDSDKAIFIEKGNVNIQGSSFNMANWNDLEVTSKLMGVTRQINKNRINDKLYNSYLIDNNIVTSNIDIPEQSDSGIFVQPLIVLEDNLDINPIEKKSERNMLINIYWGSPESSTNTRVLSNLAPRKFTWKGKEYGSVEHAYQSNKSGTFDQTTYDAYNNLKEIPGKQGSGFGAKIRGKSVQKSFDNLQLMRDLVVESFKQNPEQAKLLLNYSDFTHTTNEVIDKAFLDGIRLAQKNAELQLLETGSTFDKELAKKLQDKLQKLYPEIKLNITNNPVWQKASKNIFNQEEYNNQVNYRLKAVDILTSPKAEQVFAKGKKAGWDLNKILSELQVPKEQKQIILDKNINNKIAGKKISIVAERRKLATEWDLKNSQLIKNIRVDKTQPKDIKPNEADKNLASIMLYGHRYSDLSSLDYIDDNLSTITNPDEMQLEAETLAYRILNDLMFDIEEINEFYEEIKEHPEYANALTTSENPVKEFFENDLFEESDKVKLNLREEIITSLLANYSYTVEINTSIEPEEHTEYYKNEVYTYNGYEYHNDGDINYWKSPLGQGDYQDEITEEEYDEAVQKGKLYKDIIGKPTQYYSNLTVNEDFYKNNPDWEYKEQRLTIPLITPSIKGHAQFAESNDIGWFRAWYNKKTGEVHVLEVQSDLFQKGRDDKSLIQGKNKLDPSDLADLKEDLEDGKITKEKYDLIISGKTVNTKENQFLQLLNKDSNWVTFFVKSIVQDSAKKGYEKVLFPTGNTASKVEGHATLEDFKKQKEDRIELLEFNKSQNINNIKGEYLSNEQIDNEINQLKQELERVEKEGFGALKPIYNFYENTVGNILKKQGYNPTLITDEYGNTWNELSINQARDLDNVLLQRNEANQIIGQANIKAMTVLIDAINQKQDTLPHEYAHHYIAWFRNTPIVQEAIKKWGSEEALVQSIGEQVVKQKGEAYNWWTDFVKWILNSFNKLSSLQKEQLTEILTDAFLTRQDLNISTPVYNPEFPDILSSMDFPIPDTENKVDTNKDGKIKIQPNNSTFSEEAKKKCKGD